MILRCKTLISYKNDEHFMEPKWLFPTLVTDLLCFLAELVLSLVIYGETLTSWKITKNRFPVIEIEFVLQLWPFAYVQLLKKPYEDEVTLGEQIYP